MPPRENFENLVKICAIWRILGHIFTAEKTSFFALFFQTCYSTQQHSQNKSTYIFSKYSPFHGKIWKIWLKSVQSGAFWAILLQLKRHCFLCVFFFLPTRYSTQQQSLNKSTYNFFKVFSVSQENFSILVKICAIWRILGHTFTVEKTLVFLLFFLPTGYSTQQHSQDKSTYNYFQSILRFPGKF